MKKILALLVMGLMIMSALPLALAQSGRGGGDDTAGDDSGGIDNSPDDDGTDDRGRGLDDGLDDSPDDNVLLPGAANVQITSEDAVRRAREVGSGNLDQVELEMDNGRLVWKVRFTQPGDLRQEIRIDANSGAVTRIKNPDGTETRFDIENNVPGANPRFSADQAIAKALEVAQGTRERVELEMENGILTWKVRLMQADGNRVDIRVNADTGELLRMKFDNGPDIRLDRNVQIQANGQAQISSDDAIRKAMALAGDGSLERVELDTEDGRLVWKVRFTDAQGNRVDARVDANTGELITTRTQDDSGSGNDDRIVARNDDQRVMIDIDNDGVPDSQDSDTTKNTDKDRDGIDDTQDQTDDRTFFQKILSFFGLF